MLTACIETLGSLRIRRNRLVSWCAYLGWLYSYRRREAMPVLASDREDFGVL